MESLAMLCRVSAIPATWRSASGVLSLLCPLGFVAQGEVTQLPTRDQGSV